jgi:tRNA-modifying protein YgfZ
MTMVVLPRAVIRLTGKDVVPFLQGLLTNDMNLLDTQAGIYACLLNPQGKFLHDMFVINGLGGDVCLDVEDGARAADLVQRLNAYKLRRQVNIELVPDARVSAGVGPLPDIGIVYPDRRHPDMGWRMIYIYKASPLTGEVGERSEPGGGDLLSQDSVVLSHPHPNPPPSRGRGYEEWDQRRIQLGVADGARDAVIGISTLEELNIVKHNGVSFTKGCYVGQELTARMENRGLAKRHLYPVHLTAGSAPTDDIYAGAHKVGELRSRCGDLGLALLRDDAVAGQMTLVPDARGWQIT